MEQVVTTFPSQSSKGISVVVPIEGRSQLLERLLKSLTASRSAFEEACEIIVVDSSSGAEKVEIQMLCSEYQADYTRGPVNVREKRNLGIKQARYPIVLFIDSDCEAHPHLLFEHLRIYEDDDGHELGGVVGYIELTGNRGWIWNAIERTGFLDSLSFAKHLEFTTWGGAANISYRQDVLHKLGGFDTSFPFRLGGDDVDLGLRVNEAGYKLKCNPDAIVYHSRETWNSFRLYSRRVWRWGRMHYYMFRRYSRGHIVILPRVLTIFVVLLALMVPYGFLTRSLVFLILPFFWLLATWIMQSVLTCKWYDREGLQKLRYELVATLIELTFEGGVILESLVHADVRPFYKETSYHPKLPRRGISYARTNAKMWSMVLTLSLVLAIILISCWYLARV